MDSIPQWFEGTRLNFAENILYSASPTDPSKRATEHKEDTKIALTEVREGNTEVRHLSWGDLRRKVALLANAFRAKGLKKGDRVAVVASTSFDTFITFMAIVSIGGLFSSSSTDMGTKGILERLLQIKPAYVFIDDWTVYNGKTIDLRPKIKEIVEGMEGVIEFKGVVTQTRFPGKPASLEDIPRSVTLEEFLKAAKGDGELIFERVAFRHPFLIVYSSGTTGVPKCIVHSTGGVLISVTKEGRLHREMGPENVMLQYTTVRSSMQAWRPKLNFIRPAGSCTSSPYSAVYLAVVPCCMMGRLSFHPHRHFCLFSKNSVSLILAHRLASSKNCKNTTSSRRVCSISHL